MKKNIIITGLVSSAIVTIWMTAGMVGIIEDPCSVGDTVWGMVLGFSTMIVAFSLIFVGVKNYRDKQNGGFITFGQAFKMGVLISLIASTMYVIVWAIDYNYFIPDFFERYSAHVLRGMKASGESAAAIQGEATDLHNQAVQYKNPLFFVLYTYREILPVGLIATLICALILKRKPKADNFALAN